MKKCLPIKDKKIINAIKEEYLKRNLKKELLMFLLSINTGCLIKSLLNLTVKEVKGLDFIVLPQGNNITKIFILNSEIKNIINEVTEKCKLDDYLFLSNKKSAKNDKKTLISRMNIYQHFKDICKDLELSNDISISSWRRTYGYFHYMENKDLVFLSWYFGHKNIFETYTYIDITKENPSDKYREVLGL